MTARRPHDDRPAEAGFSLVEVLVTLTILAAFMAVFTPFVGRLMSTWARNADGAQRADMVATAIGRIAGDAAAALPATEFREGSDPRVRFTGTPSGYTLLLADATVPQAVSVSAAEGGPGSHSLLRTARPATHAGPVAPKASRVALLDYPVTAEFAYRSAKGGDSSNWRDAPTLPAAIVVTFRRGKDVMFGGPVVVPVRATLPVDCVVADQPVEALCGKASATPASGEAQEATSAAASAGKATGAATESSSTPAAATQKASP